MKFTSEMLEKARADKTAEELKEIAKAEGVELTVEGAEKAFAELNKSGELSDDELNNVAGGGCGGEDGSPDGRAKSESAVVFMYAVGQTVKVIGWCTSEGTVKETKAINTMGGYYPYYKVEYKSGGSGWVAQSAIEKQ